MDEIDIEGDDEPVPSQSDMSSMPTTSQPTFFHNESTSLEQPGDLAQLLEQYPEPVWLANQTEWNGSFDSSMDDQSRALIESMIAEEELYFGQATVSLSPSIPSKVEPQSESQEKKALKRKGGSLSAEEGKKKQKRDKTANDGTHTSHKLKWTKEEDEKLHEGIKLYGYGSWKQIASFLKTRTALQIKNHVRHLTVHAGIRFEGANSGGSADDATPLSDATAIITNAVKLQHGAEDEDVDIDITDDDADDDPLSVQPKNVPSTADKDQDVTPPPDTADEEPPSNGEETTEPSVLDIDENVIADESPLISGDITGSPENLDRAMDVDESPLSEHPLPTSEAFSSSHYAPAGDAAEGSTLVDEAPQGTDRSKVSERHEVSPTSPNSEAARSTLDATQSEVPIAPAVSLSDTFILNDLICSDSREQSSPDNFTIDRDTIQRMEVSALPEWFLSTLALAQGKKPHPRTLHKTPERYKKIRNYILAAWDKCKPKYLTKTSVRPGLRGEGDVNAIGRIHEFLENVGGINVGCIEKGGRKNYGNASSKKVKDELADDMTEMEAGKVWNFLEEGKRKRRVRNYNGEWVDADDPNAVNQGISDAQREELEIAREEARMFALNSKYFADAELEKFDKRLLKRRKRQVSAEDRETSDALGEYDPFRLIPAREYTAEIPAPFHVSIRSNAMIVMDFHAHLAHTEIIGLLGGQYDPQQKLIRVEDVFPCRSMSTGVQCEMDPDSEMQAREVFHAKGYEVVGWYHSHPTFDPTPSIRDIENQTTYQTLFQRQDGVEPFIGAIVTPYDAKHAADRKSRFGWLSISQEWNSLHEYRLPYSCDVNITASDALTGELFQQLSELLKEYRTHEHRVDLLKPYSARYDPSFTRLDKLVHSIETHANLTGSMETQAFITRLREIVLKGFCSIPNNSLGEMAEEGNVGSIAE